MQADFERLAGRGTRRVGLSLASRHLNGDLFHHREDGSWKSLAGRAAVAHSCHFLRRLPFDAADRTVATPTLSFIPALTIFTNSNWCARRKRDLMAIRRWSIVWTRIEREWICAWMESEACTGDVLFDLKLYFGIIVSRNIYVTDGKLDKTFEKLTRFYFLLVR